MKNKILFSFRRNLSLGMSGSILPVLVKIAVLFFVLLENLHPPLRVKSYSSLPETSLIAFFLKTHCSCRTSKL